MSASRRFLRFAEYTAVSAAVLGAVATIKTQQPAYAIAPLTIAATLNLLGRHQTTRQLDQTAENLSQQVLGRRHEQQTADQINQRLDIVGQQGLRRQEAIDTLSQQVAQQTKATQATLLDTQSAQAKFTKQLSDQQTQLAHQSASIKSAQSQMAEYKAQTTAQISAQATQSEQTRLRLEALSSAVQQARAQIEAATLALNNTLDALPAQTESVLSQYEKRVNKIVSTAQQSAAVQQSETAAKIDQWSQSFAESTAELSHSLEHLTQELNALSARVDSLALLETKPTLKIEPKDTDDQTTGTNQNPEFAHLVPNLPNTQDDYDLGINIGIDFGTGYTKVCFRDIVNDRSEVVTFAAPADDGLPLSETLMPTRLAILEDGTLLSGLTVAEWEQCDRPIRQEINYIKMRLAAIDLRRENAADDWRLGQIPELDDDETVESLCAYYLSGVIKRSQRWIQQNRPDLFANQTVRWSVNIGVPVEYCDSPALDRFRRVLALAWLLKSTEVDTSSLTVDRLNRLIAHLRTWLQTHKKIEELDCTTTPEIAAAVWSFINSRQAQEGFYTFFDVGDGTLDGAAFIFKQGDGDRQVDFYIGQVEPLGVTAFIEKTAAELDRPAQSVRDSLVGDFDADLGQQVKESRARKKVQQMIASVVMEGNERHQQIRQFSVQQDIGDRLKVFVGGGGSNTRFFPETIHSTHRDFNHASADIPPYELRRIPTPDDLSINGLDQKNFNRFAIAYGLCIPEGEGPEIKLPSQFDGFESASEISDHLEVESYEDTRDLM